VSTEEFIEKLVTGSKEHWDEFVERYNRLIYKTFHAPSFRFSKEEIEDLFHDFMVMLLKDNFRKIRLFEGRNNCSLPTYLRKIAVNLAIDRQKRNIRRRSLSLNMPALLDGEAEVGDFVEAPGSEPTEPISDEETRLRYLWALYAMDVPKLLVTLLVIYQEWNREKIAAHMSTTRQNVDVLYKRGKDKMIEMIAGKKSSEALVEEHLEWPDEIVAQRNKAITLDRGLLFDRCLKSLDVPDDLVAGLLFANAPVLHPTPDRFALLFKSTPGKECVRAARVFEKLGI